MEPAMLAGTVSTALFAAANLPMVVKAVRTGDLRSYSASALILGNVGNLVHTVYVVSLPFGPIWVLHGFYLASMAIMLALYALPMRARSAGAAPATGAGAAPAAGVHAARAAGAYGARAAGVHAAPAAPSAQGSAATPAQAHAAAVRFPHGGHDRRTRAGSDGVSVR